MRRVTKKVHKPKVRWLQDPAIQNLNGIATSTGVVPTTLFPYFNDMRPGTRGDPAGVMGGGAQVNETTATPRAQLLVEPGYRIMRIVGDLWVAIKQVITGPEAAVAAPYWAVSMGLCLCEVDEDGNVQDSQDWQLGYPNAISVKTTAETAAAMEGMGRSWIWRRTWLLQNFAAGMPSATQFPNVGDQWAVSPGVVGPAPNDYGLGYSSNTKYPAMLGSHFDIKRHVTFKRRQAPFWAFHAIDLQGGTDTFAQFEMLRSYRTLIARAGRPWKDER